LQSEDFAVYENYCSKYDLLYEDMDILRKTLSAPAFFDQGIEALAKSVASTTSRRLEDRKSMTLKDLLIKVCQSFTLNSSVMLKPGCQPVQRVCKYPLLLQDLLKCTPASDCPLAFSEINQVLDEIRLLLVKIDTATGNPVHRDRIQKTIVLQERLDYSGQVSFHFAQAVCFKGGCTDHFP
jgi:guanine nucleotide exchange factor for Rho/Rac/Cdc42-like GTPase family protein